MKSPSQWPPSRKEWIESTAERAAKKIRLDDAAEFSFKKRGLKKQHKNCAAVLTAIEDAIESLNNDDVETAKSVLEQIKSVYASNIQLLKFSTSTEIFENHLRLDL